MGNEKNISIQQSDIAEDKICKSIDAEIAELGNRVGLRAYLKRDIQPHFNAIPSSRVLSSQTMKKCDLFMERCLSQANKPTNSTMAKPSTLVGAALDLHKMVMGHSEKQHLEFKGKLDDYGSKIQEAREKLEVAGDPVDELQDAKAGLAAIRTDALTYSTAHNFLHHIG